MGCISVMVETKFSWHGIPREEIEWHPTVEGSLCIGCGICVLGCGPGVFKFDYDANRPIVANPLNCKVGCVTCANTCPTHAISFPPLTYLHKQYKPKNVIKNSRKEVQEKKPQYTR